MKNKKILMGIIFVAINMRMPITIIPPIIDTLKKSVGLPDALAGMVTSIPLLTFAIMSPIIVRLAKKFGNQLTIFILFSLLVLGSFLRIIPTIFALVFGTFLIGVGIDSANVLLPAVIKEEFPQKTAVGTSLYTVSMMLAASIGSALSGYLIGIVSLKNTLLILSLVTVLGLFFWFPNLKDNDRGKYSNNKKITKYQTVWNQPIAWLVTALFGIQALLSYSFIAWIPGIIQSQGASHLVASSTLTVFQFAGIPFAFITPILAEKKWGMKFLIALIFIGYAGGSLGMLFSNMGTMYYLFQGFIVGSASSIGFNLTIVFFTHKTTNPVQTAEVSGMAQSFGYLLAAVGPTLFGILHVSANNWNMPLYISIVLTIIMTLITIILYKSAKIKE